MGNRGERRAHERIDMSRPARVVVLERDDDSGPWSPTEQWMARSRDLSSGGVSVLLPTRLPDGQPVLLMMPGKDNAIRLFGRIRYAEPASSDPGFWTGVEFFGMPANLEGQGWVLDLTEAA